LDTDTAIRAVRVTVKLVEKGLIIIIIIIIIIVRRRRKCAYSQALSMNRRRGQSPGGQMEYVNC